MPLPDRDLAGEVTHSAGVADRDAALEVLLHRSLEQVVALACWRDGADVHVANSEGHCLIGPDSAVTVVTGRNPLAEMDPFSDSTSCFPLAGSRLHSLFREPRAPDIAVVHTGAHCWAERGGHLGEHGSLNGVQSRAPLVLSGAGVTERGVVARYGRMVDVGATLADLCGGSYDDMDGRPLAGAVPGADHVVGLLWDGAQCADLLRLAAAGELPNVQRLLDRGCAYQGGVIAEFPSVTLVNHTSALTGLGPGRHGIVHNAFFDRSIGEQVVPNSSAVWYRSMDYLRPDVRTVWERLPVGASSACVNEPCDRGATYSTFALIRESGQAGTGSLAQWLPSAADDPHATQEHVASNSDYSWSTQVDAAGLSQVLDLWRDGAPPLLTWWNTTLTDSGHHAGGPGSQIARASMRDADRRLGVWLDLVEERGLHERVTVLLTADHGSEAADPECTGDWDDALRAAGIAFRDEAFGFLYLGD